MQVFSRAFNGIKEPSAFELRFNWFRDVVFPLAMQDEAAFRNAILSPAAVHLATMKGMATSSEVEYEQFWSLRLLREHFHRRPNDASDSAIVMCLFRSILESKPMISKAGNPLIHMRQVMQMIRTRGGPEALSNNPLLVMLTNICYYCCTEYDARALRTKFENHSEGTFDNKSSNSISSDVTERQVAYDDFLKFLKDVKALSIVQQGADYKRSALIRHSVFRPGTVIYGLLSLTATSSPIDGMGWY